VDGVHDLGGMHGFGPVEIELGEPVFHRPWEGRTYGLVAASIAMAGINTPMFRHAIERMDPAHYLSSSYYEHWLTALATLLVENGVLSAEELSARAGSFPLSRAATVAAAQLAAAPRDASGTPRFVIGEEVRVRHVQFAGHTRCPRYLRGHTGKIVRVDEVAPVPEIEAHRRERVLEPLYCVRFEAAVLWGEGAERSVAIHVDLYERYLEPQQCEVARP
jgi:nitrile hydratase subunit beta